MTEPGFSVRIAGYEGPLYTISDLRDLKDVKLKFDPITKREREREREREILNRRNCCNDKDASVIFCLFIQLSLV